MGGILGAALFLLIRNEREAYIFSFLAGLSCGIPVAAYAYLVIRSCPPQLEGAAWMLYASGSAIAGDVSDVFGSWLYTRGGFNLALIDTAMTTSMILVVIYFVPRAITNPMEGVPIHEPELVEGLSELALEGV